MPSIQLNFEKLVTSLLQDLQEAETQESDLPTRLDTCIRACEERLQLLRRWVIDNAFPDNDTEIYFFKKIKPEVVGHYLFYRKQFSLHLSSCSLSREMRMSLYQMNLNEIQQFFAGHQFDYIYHITGDTCHDELYFLRSNYDWKLCQSDHYPAEPGFATNGDGILANILANKLWGAYLQQQLWWRIFMHGMHSGGAVTIRLRK
jgi:hypothetical protein